jgi:hypothetical protein
LIVREVMEGIYRKFDQNGVTDNRAALAALLDNGLNMVPPDSGQIGEWRGIVNQSAVELAKSGTFDIALLDQMQELLNTYRSDAVAAAP